MKNSKFFKIIILTVCAMMVLTGCGESKMYQKQVFSMDTVMTLTAYGKKAESALSSAEASIIALNNMVDPDIETSITYAINHAQGEELSVTGPVAEMLTTAKEVYEQTGGLYDLTIYPLIERWGFTNNKYYIPTAEEIAQDLGRLCMDQITIKSFPTSGTFTVWLPSFGELSFASCAKGCAAKYAVDAMRKAGVTSGIVSLGGNVQTLGVKPDGSDWTIGITDPNDTSTYLATITVGEAAVVTSGPYQRYMPSNPAYHHIFNPKTGYPTENGLSSVTIICKDGTMADCLSTAMFVEGKNGALNYWREYGDEGLFEMIIITDSHQIIATKGLIENIDLKNKNYTLSFYE